MATRLTKNTVAEEARASFKRVPSRRTAKGEILPPAILRDGHAQQAARGLLRSAGWPDRFHGIAGLVSRPSRLVCRRIIEVDICRIVGKQIESLAFGILSQRRLCPDDIGLVLSLADES
jgi:hypothetical protein